MEDALKEFDRLMREEVPMAIAQILEMMNEHKDGAEPIRPVTHLMLNLVPPNANKANVAMAIYLDEMKCS